MNMLNIVNFTNSSKPSTLSQKESKKKDSMLLNVRIIPLLVISSLLLVGNADGNTENDESKKSAYFTLTVKEDLISLDAKDASLKEIIEEIGHRMKIEVDANISKDEKVTQKFEKLPLADALKKLSSNYGYIVNTEKNEKKVVKIFVLLKGKPAPDVKPLKPETKIEDPIEEEKPEPKHFKFEFDPSEYLNK